MNGKVRQEHLARPAVVYIRQSTLAQVLEHRQSTERQYNLATLAKQLGWDESQIKVIDEDLAHSGESVANRSGFQRLAAEVSLGKVGAILSLEVSRLARSSADWHRLLDLCALSGALIIDDDGIYDPNDFNDRLVLGMKGTMSDAERHVMRLRLQGGKLHKAKKGMLAYPPPTGYIFDEDGALVLDPDEHVQEAIRLLFERFRFSATAYAVVRYFAFHKILFPSRHAHKDAPAQVIWRSLTHARLLTILKNPVYAGAYCWGRRQTRRVLADGAVVQRRSEIAAPEQWHAFIKNAHVGYITWEDYMANLKRLGDNRTTKEGQSRGAPRRGHALLQGLAICGRCGRRMKVAHPRNECATYECRKQPDLEHSCWAVSSRYVDQKVVEVFLDAVAPSELDLSLAVTNEVDRQAADIDRQWRLRLERARYEAERFERQYNAVEPENRIVARTLETRWNQKLQEVSDIEREYEETRQAHRLVLSKQDKQTIRKLARDLSRVWTAETTTHAERKQLLRLLIQDITLTPVSAPHRMTKIQILWKTNAVTEVHAPRPRAGNKTPTEIIELIRRLAGKRMNDAAITDELNRLGCKSGKGREFTKQAVVMLRSGYEIHSSIPCGGSKPLPERDDLGRYSVHGLASRYAVTPHIVRYWIGRGVVDAQRDYKGGPLWIELDSKAKKDIAKAQRRGYGPRGDGHRGHPKPLPLRDEKGRYSTRGLVEKYGVPVHIVRYWIATGIVAPERDRPNANLRFRITAATDRRIRATLKRRAAGQRKKRVQHQPNAGAKN